MNPEASRTPRRTPDQPTMTERKNSCILVAEVAGVERLIHRLNAEEAQHAVDRCLNRIDRVVESNGGDRLTRDPQGLSAGFERCDAAILAACEMLERVMSLPPMSGVQPSTRIGVHYGPLEAGPRPSGEGLTVARRLAASAKAGQALASGAAVMLLSTPARHFAGTEGSRSLSMDGMDWPVYEIGHKTSGQITALPPSGKLSQQLRIRHQNERLMVDEQRPVLLIGREQGNDVVIIDPRASRQHARIERRGAGFYLIDQSSNGTYVAIEGQGERFVRQAETLLNGPGRIGCGFSAAEIERDLVFFELL